MKQNLFEAAKTAESPEELLAMAIENQIELTPEQAREHFARLHQTGELSDEELDNVAGGCCGGKRTASSAQMACPACGNICRDGCYESNYPGLATVIFQCGCGKSFRGVYHDSGNYAEEI